MQALTTASHVLSSNERSHHHLGDPGSFAVRRTDIQTDSSNPLCLTSWFLTHLSCCSSSTTHQLLSMLEHYCNMHRAAHQVSACRELFQMGICCFDIDIVTTSDQQLLVTHPSALQVRHSRQTACVSLHSSTISLASVCVLLATWTQQVRTYFSLVCRRCSNVCLPEPTS